MEFLKQSTAFSETIGPILDSAGAEFTTAVIGDLSISKNGTEAAMAATATLTHVSNGHYTLAGIVGNADTLGRLTIRVNKATYQMPGKEYMVLPATVYDALVTNAAGGANGLLLSLASNQVDLGKILGTAVPAPTVAGVPNVNVKTINDVATTPVTTIKAVQGLAVDGVVTTVTNQLTAAQIATGVWQDTTAGDFTTALSIGKSIMNGVSLGTGLTIVGVSGAVGSVTGAVGSVTGLTASNLDATVSSRLATAGYTAPSNLTAAQIATGVWQDTTAGDFTVALSVGKSIMNGVALGTGLTINAYSGNTPQTADVATLITTVGVAGAGLTAADDAVLTQIALVKAQTDLVTLARMGVLTDWIDGGRLDLIVDALLVYPDRTVCRGTVGATAPGTTSFTPSALSPAGVAADQFKGRIIVFDVATTTTALRGQATDITASSAATLPLLTYTALTTTPVSGDTFSIV